MRLKKHFIKNAPGVFFQLIYLKEGAFFIKSEGSYQIFYIRYCFKSHLFYFEIYDII